MAIIHAHFSIPVVLSEVAIIQIGNTQIATTNAPPSKTKPKDISGNIANKPKIQRNITSKFPNVFITFYLSRNSISHIFVIALKELRILCQLIKTIQNSKLRKR